MDSLLHLRCTYLVDALSRVQMDRQSRDFHVDMHLTLAQRCVTKRLYHAAYVWIQKALDEMYPNGWVPAGFSVKMSVINDALDTDAIFQHTVAS